MSKPKVPLSKKHRHKFAKDLPYGSHTNMNLLYCKCGTYKVEEPTPSKNKDCKFEVPLYSSISPLLFPQEKKCECDNVYCTFSCDPCKNCDHNNCRDKVKVAPQEKTCSCGARHSITCPTVKLPHCQTPKETTHCNCGFCKSTKCPSREAKVEDWEERFDSKFAVIDLDGVTYLCDFDKQELLDLYEPIKSFIKSQLQQVRESEAKFWMEEIRKFVKYIDELKSKLLSTR